MSDFATNRSVQQRVNDALIYILGQNNQPTLDNWWDAIDDLFGDFSYDEKMRVIEAGDTLLKQARQSFRPKPLLLLPDLRRK